MAFQESTWIGFLVCLYLSSCLDDERFRNTTLTPFLPLEACQRRGNDCYWPKNMSLLYTVRNQVRPPVFEHTIDMEFGGGEPFIRIMERAADKDRNFEFVCKYTVHGHFIHDIRGLAGEYDNVTSTYWSLLVKDQSGSTGVTSLYPKDGDAIIFNYTQVFNKDLASGPIQSSTHLPQLIG